MLINFVTIGGKSSSCEPDHWSCLPSCHISEIFWHKCGDDVHNLFFKPLKDTYFATPINTFRPLFLHLKLDQPKFQKIRFVQIFVGSPVKIKSELKTRSHARFWLVGHSEIRLEINFYFYTLWNSAQKHWSDIFKNWFSWKQMEILSKQFRSSGLGNYFYKHSSRCQKCITTIARLTDVPKDPPWNLS